jgi:DNA-binding NtrC family response regulator
LNHIFEISGGSVMSNGQSLPFSGTVLIVEDQPEALMAMSEALKRQKYQVLEASDGIRASQFLDRDGVDVLVTRLMLPEMDGTQLLRVASAKTPPVPVVAVTGSGAIQAAVETMKLGAVDCLTRPLRMDVFLESVRNALERRRMLVRDREAPEDITGFGGLLGSSNAMQEVFIQIRRIAPLRSTVLITGESGTGKELVARAIHALSPRSKGPFIPVNCSALPGNLVESQLFGHEKGAFTGATASRRGLFEAADKGVLFLDEIGDLALEAQAKLLRTLEDREVRRLGSIQPVPVDVRLLTATNTNLEAALKTRRFREDLYYRIKIFTIAIAPLRERTEDIPLLVRVFLDRFATENHIEPKGITPDALAALMTFPWPGNVRQLKNVLEGLAIQAQGPVIDFTHIQQELQIGEPQPEDFHFPVGMTMEDVERAVIRRTLEYTRGNRTHAARSLHIGLRTLQRKIKQFGLH